MTCHDVIHPTMYLLAYGATPAVFNTYDHVPLRDIFSSVGQRWSPAPPPQAVEGRRADAGPPLDFEGYIDGPGERSPLMPYDAPTYFWSPGFQLLPCDTKFTESGSGVAISSYINNLHPGRYVAVYKAIESVTAATVPMWNCVLVKQDKDRLPPRIRTYGPLIEPPGPPSWLDRVVRLQNPSVEDRSGPAYQEALSLVKQYLAQPEPPATEMLPTARGSAPWPMHDWDTSQRDFSETIHKKLDRLRHTVHPEPGVSYTYEDWKPAKPTGPSSPVSFANGWTFHTRGGLSWGPSPTAAAAGHGRFSTWNTHWNTPTTFLPRRWLSTPNGRLSWSTLTISHPRQSTSPRHLRPGASR